MNRANDWLEQAGRDIEHSRLSLDNGFYEWACFSAQQAAEKAVKALIQTLGGEGWGHSVTRLLEELPEEIACSSELIENAKELDQHYILSRYPNAHPQGAPTDYYTRNQAQRIIEYAEEIIRFCENKISQS